MSDEQKLIWDLPEETNVVDDDEIEIQKANAGPSKKVKLKNFKSHDKLLGLDVPDQHPIPTIIGLQDALDGKADDPHTHVEADITDLDKYTQAEVDAKDAAHANRTDNPHNVTAEQVGGAPEVHQHTEADITDLNRMRWRNEWIASSYIKNDVVRDGDWTMVANKDTSDRAAPQPLGFQRYLYSGSAPTTTTTAKRVIQGTRYTLSASLFVLGYRIFTVAGNNYDVYSVKDPLGAKVITNYLSFTATDTRWEEFSLGTLLISGGSVFDVVVVQEEPDPAPTIVSANYEYKVNNNETVPLAGEITHANKLLSELWIHKTDYDSTDRAATLLGMAIGDKIELAGLGDRYDVVAPPVDNGTYVAIQISPWRQTATGVQQVHFETTAPVALEYLYDNNYWFTNLDLEGLFIADGEYEDIVPDQNAYGVDLLVENAYISPDWDLLALSNAEAGGVSQPGDGVQVWRGPEPPVDTQKYPFWFDTSPGLGELRIWYDDPDSSEWVVANSVAQEGVSGEFLMADGSTMVVKHGLIKEIIPSGN